MMLISSPLLSAVGLSPPQLRVENPTIGERTAVATLVVTNTDNVDSYLIFKISCLERTRESKLRVICTACKRDVGIQRGDLIHPVKITNITGMNGTIEYGGKNITISGINASYSIGDFILFNDSFVVLRKIDSEEALLNRGYCPFCGASEDKLIFYDFPPIQILSNVTLSSGEFQMILNEDGTYRTEERLKPKQHIDVDISVSIPDTQEMYGKHWELRIMATSKETLNDSKGMAMVYGAETKFLIDTPVLLMEEKQGMNALVLVSISGIVGVVIIAAFLLMKKTFHQKRKPLKESILKGRKIL